MALNEHNSAVAVSAIKTFGHFDGRELKTDRTDGPRAVTGVRVASNVRASISQPVM